MSESSSLTEKCRFSRIRESVLVGLVLLACCVGCQLDNRERLRKVAKIVSLGKTPIAQVNKVSQPRRLTYLEQLVKTPPAPSDRTTQVLRRYYLLEKQESDPEYVIRYLQEVCRGTPHMEDVHALAETTLIRAKWLTRIGKKKMAQQMYATAMFSAYQFLFDQKLELQRNAYDPHFRNICDIYNESLENILRNICESEGLRNEATYQIEGVAESGIKFDLQVRFRGRWKTHEFDKIELANDYEMDGIANRYHTYGLGVPLIAVHQQHDHDELPSEQYYPPSLTLPLTAFCEAACNADGHLDHGDSRTVTLSVFDPLEKTYLQVADRTVPLESDITIPLAYRLNDPLLNTGVLETISMFNPDVISELYGLMLTEPYDESKIPVIFVHGLWSSPITWLEMYNDLRAIPELRSRYQFWFYAYPTGQAFWRSAQQMRYDLAQLKQNLDPQGTSDALTQMVLIGHSMGGLVSRLQTIDSEDHFWQLVSKTEFDRWRGDREALERLRETFFFDANPNVKRVITMASPHEGSRLANNLTRWAGQKFFTLPANSTADFRKLANTNSEYVIDRALLTANTSIDSLSPGSSFIRVMNLLEPSQDVHYHNVVGNVPRDKWLTKVGVYEDGDGVVSLASGRGIEAESEIEVLAEHQEVHQHPQSILEVRRILLEHLKE